MSSGGTLKQPSFSELVFSDYSRYRPGKPSWVKVLSRCLTIPGLIASILVRGQQCLYRAGYRLPADALRTVAMILIGAEFGAGMEIGKGLMLVHPVGVTIGFGLKIGDNVSLGGGVTCAARYYDSRAEQEYAEIGSGAIIGAHAVLVGGVKIGENAMVGANSVVLSDVPANAVVMGVPARQVGVREQAAS
jgi:serine O-acetyltransferase